MGNVVNVKFNMNTQDVTNARSPDRSQDHAVSVITSRRKKTLTRDIVETFQIHEFPDCVQCQHYRIKPGRCTNCGAVGPDNTEWIYTCLGQDAEYEEIMTPILEARKIKVAEQTKQFTTYKNCPLCRGYFHSAKACIFRTHVKHFNILQKKMDQYSDEINTTARMVIPTTDSDTDSEEEEDYSDESEEEDCGTYMMIVHHGNSSDEESMEEDGRQLCFQTKASYNV